MQVRKLEATKPYNLAIQNFNANRLWALGLQAEATEVYAETPLDLTPKFWTVQN